MESNGTSGLHGNFFARGDYLRTDVVRGVARNRMGTRMVSLTCDFLLGFRRALEDECGPAASTVLASCGRKWGVLLAKRFAKEMGEFYQQPLQEMSLPMLQGCLVEMFSQNGFGKLRLDLDRHDRGLILVEVGNAFMADVVEQADRPVDTLLAGILAGFFSHLSGQNLDCVQTDCQACGADASRFIIALAERMVDVSQWRDEGRSHEDILTALEQIRL